jgi:diguanylate cyclase (GGDEF)-like protein/PAS domain S-box-containing protein
MQSTTGSPATSPTQRCWTCGRPADWLVLAIDAHERPENAVHAETVCSEHRDVARYRDETTAAVALTLRGRSDTYGGEPAERAVLRHPQADEVIAATLALALPTAALLTEASGSLLFANAAWQDLTGQDLDAARGMRWLEVIHHADADRIRELFGHPATRTSQTLSLEVRSVMHEDRQRWLRVEARALRALGSTSVVWVFSFVDITDLKDEISQLEYGRTRDALTGALNRTELVEHTGRALARQLRHTWTVAALFIDLEGFGNVNDVYGFEHGDQVLRALAHRIRSSLRLGDTFGRYGGDAFVAVCEQIDDETQAISIVRRILREVAEPITIGTNTTRLQASIGVALADHANLTAEEVISRADMAMYIARQRGEGYALAAPPSPA